jgi:hypothetical protein
MGNKILCLQEWLISAINDWGGFGVWLLPKKKKLLRVDNGLQVLHLLKMLRMT